MEYAEVCDALVYLEPLFQIAPEGMKRLMVTTQMAGTSRVSAVERCVPTKTKRHESDQAHPRHGGVVQLRW